MSTGSAASHYALHNEFELVGEPRVAVSVIDMVASAHEWIHRRVEQVELLSDKLCFRKVSLDLTVPNPCGSRIEWFDGREYTLVPLDILAKGPLQRFSLTDAAGNPISSLTRRQNGELAWKGLTNMARLELPGEPSQTPIWLDHLLRVVAQDRSEDGSAALRVLKQWGTASGEEASELRDFSRLVWADQGIRTAVNMLAENFLLIAMVDVEPGSRVILKYSYEEEFRGSLDDERSPDDRRRERWGWDPTGMSFPVPSFTDCESYHFEVSAPGGIQLLEISLRDVDREDPVDPRWVLGYRRVAESSPERAHLTTGRTADPDASPADFVEPRVVVQMRVDRNGWLRSAAFAACAVALFFVASLRWVLWPEVPASESSVSNADPAALTAALLGVLSVLLVRSGEHGYTAKLLRPLRYATFASAAIPFAGAWLLAFPGEGTFRSAGWCVLTAAAVALAWGLVRVWHRAAPSVVSDPHGSIVEKQTEEAT